MLVHRVLPLPTSKAAKISLPPDITQALVRTLELKDASTAAHTWRVVLYTRALAESFGLAHGYIERLSVGAALHDVGKIEIPDEILLKPDKLTAEEFEVIKTHPALGYERLKRMGEDDELVLELVRHHHERVDGLGYPDGLLGSSIPMPAKYFAVVDTFDALTSYRPYRRDIGHDAGVRAIEELERSVGTRYCGECVEAFKGLFEAGELDWIMEHFNDRCELPTYFDPQAARRIAKR